MSFLVLPAGHSPANVPREMWIYRNMRCASGVELWGRLARRPSKLPGFPNTFPRPRAQGAEKRLKTGRTFGRDPPGGNGQGKCIGNTFNSARQAI